MGVWWELLNCGLAAAKLNELKLDCESNQFQSDTTIKAAAKLVAEYEPPGVIVILTLFL